MICPSVRPPFCSRRDQIARVVLDDVAEDVLAGRVDPVRQHQHHRHQQQVSRLEHQREGLRVLCGLGLRRRYRFLARRQMRALATVDVVRQEHLGAEHGGSEQEQLIDADRLDQPVGDARAEHRAERGAKADDREQALALGLVVDDVGERPELRDNHQREDADPDEEGYGERDADLRQKVEHHEARREKRRHDIDEAHARSARDQLGVERHDEGQDDDLSGRHVGLELGRPLPEDERLAHRLEDVVRHQDQEHVQRQKQRRKTLARVHVGKDAEKPVERRAMIRFWCRHSESCPVLS